MKKVNVFAAGLVILACVAVVQATPSGSILSYFNPGVNQIYGLEMRETEGFEGGGTSQLHGVVASGAETGQVYRFDVSTASDVKSGSLSTYDSKTQMMKTGVSANTAGGLAIMPTYAAPYGTQYVTNMNHWWGVGLTYASNWSESTPPGSLDWSLLATTPGEGGYWNGNWDFSAAYRTFPANEEMACWMTWSKGVSNGVTPPTPYGLYYYSSVYQWGGGAPGKVLAMPKEVWSVTIGQGEGINADLYVLCADKEILHVDAATGNILDRFYTQVANPIGMTYDVSEGSLWISDYGTNNIYQVAVPEPVTAVMLGIGGLIGLARRRSRS
jgi:hypothetical protein